MNNLWPFFESDEIEAVTKVLQSGNVNYWSGENCKAFEQEFCAYMGSQFAITLSNGTVALELALHALGVGSRNGGYSTDEVIVTPRSFFASASAIIHAGAVPVFADISLADQTICPNSIAESISCHSKAIICVHLAGVSCDMEPIMEIAKKHDLFVVEDCAQAHGAKYKGRLVGTIGHIGAWSFCQDKIISTGGEGGMVATNERKYWEKMWSYKDHGKSYDAVFNKSHEPGFRWLHETFGSNLRMTEMQAAIGRRQLAKLDNWLQRRRDIFHRIKASLSQDDLLKDKISFLDANGNHANEHHDNVMAPYTFNFYLKIGNSDAAAMRNKALAAMNDKGVPILVGGCPEIYEEKAFLERYKTIKPLQNASFLAERCLMLRINHRMNFEQVDEYCAVILNVLRDNLG